MTLVVIGALVAVLFQRALRRHERQWEDPLVHRPTVKALAIVTFLIWACIIVLGRLIAYLLLQLSFKFLPPELLAARRGKVQARVTPPRG